MLVYFQRDKDIRAIRGIRVQPVPQISQICTDFI